MRMPLGNARPTTTLWAGLREREREREYRYHVRGMLINTWHKIEANFVRACGVDGRRRGWSQLFWRESTGQDSLRLAGLLQMA